MGSFNKIQELFKKNISFLLFRKQTNEIKQLEIVT